MPAGILPAKNHSIPRRRDWVREDPPDRRTFDDRLRCGEGLRNDEDRGDYGQPDYWFPDLDDGDPDTVPDFPVPATDEEFDDMVAKTHDELVSE